MGPLLIRIVYFARSVLYLLLMLSRRVSSAFHDDTSLKRLFNHCDWARIVHSHLRINILDFIKHVFINRGINHTILWREDSSIGGLQGIDTNRLLMAMLLNHRVRERRMLLAWALMVIERLRKVFVSSLIKWPDLIILSWINWVQALKLFLVHNLMTHMVLILYFLSCISYLTLYIRKS